MHIGVPLETQTGETRVAATPETIKKLIGQGELKGLLPDESREKGRISFSACVQRLAD